MVTQITPLETSISLVLPPAHLCKPFFIARLPLPPGINHSYQIVRTRDGSRLASTPAQEAFKQEAALRLNQAEHDISLVNAIRASKRKVPLAVEMRFYFLSMWKRDVDGGVKAVLDAVFKHLELNDTLVVDLNITKQESDDPRVEVEVRCLLSAK